MKPSVGDILKINTSHILPHRSVKWSVCVCISKNYVLFINSENRAIYDCIDLKKIPDRKFPYHDSYVGCANVYEVFNYQILEISAKITQQEALLIIEKIEKSKRIPPAQKLIILKELTKFAE